MNIYLVHQKMDIDENQKTFEEFSKCKSILEIKFLQIQQTQYKINDDQTENLYF
jgi:hypothetical protein